MKPRHCSFIAGFLLAILLVTGVQATQAQETINIGDTKSGELTATSPQLAYIFNATQQQEIEITITAFNGAVPALTITSQSNDPNIPPQIFSNAEGTTTLTEVVAFPQAGAYFITVSSANGLFGPVTVEVKTVTPPLPLPVGQPQTQNISFDQEIKFQFQGNPTQTANLTFINSNPQGGLRVILEDGNGNKVAEISELFPSFELQTPQGPLTYTVRIGNVAPDQQPRTATVTLTLVPAPSTNTNNNNSSSSNSSSEPTTDPTVEATATVETTATMEATETMDVTATVETTATMEATETMDATQGMDSDGDGIPDGSDKCPNSVDLVNRPVGSDGCHDADGDGLTGDDDLCGNSAGPANTYGCPDADGDGLAYDPDYVNQISPRDNCPNEFGPASNSGCPEETNNAPPPPDRDGDGVSDSEDSCPDNFGAAENSGCPLDADSDGYTDDIDACPNSPAAPTTLDGCPDGDGDGFNDFIDACPSSPAAAGSTDGC